MQVRGFPPARTQAERRDATLLPLLGGPHDDSVPQGACMCALCTFNRGDLPATRTGRPAKCASEAPAAAGVHTAFGVHTVSEAPAVAGEESAGEAAAVGKVAVKSLLGSSEESAGEAAAVGKVAGLCHVSAGEAAAVGKVAGLCHVAPRVMVADAKECGEGISFLGVRRLLLADVPVNAEEWMQRVGRAVRFMGHGTLPPDERHVQVRLLAPLIALRRAARAGPPAAERD